MVGRLTRNWRSGASSAALAVLLGVFFPALPWLADFSYDLPFAFASEGEMDEPVLIYMDEDSQKELQQPGQHMGWNRAIHADLVRRLTESKARAIVFDIVFDAATTNDSILLAAIRDATNAGTRVIIGATIDAPSQSSRISGVSVLAPTEAFEKAVPWGFAEQGRTDGVLRKHYEGAKDLDVWVPSLSWRAAELTLTNLTGGPRDSRWINYYGPGGVFRFFSFYAALKPELIPSSAFSNKVCFVGSRPATIPYSASTLTDEWRTPFTWLGKGRMPGVNLIATVYMNLLRGDWIHRVGLPLQLFILLTTGLLFGFGLTLLRPGQAVAVGAASMVLITVAACWLMLSQHVWFSWLAIVGVQIPVAVGWSVLAYSKRLARDRESLEQQLASAQTALKEVVSSADGAATFVGDGPASSDAATIVLKSSGDGQSMVPDHDLIRRVGKGAYGEVWLARNVISTYHAVKIIRREDFESDDPYEREFRGIQKFMPISRSHPGFVQILHTGRNQQQRCIYCIMEVADDETTGQKIDPENYKPRNLAKEIKNRGHLPVAECVQLGLDLAAALEFLHREHLIHRDIKPANIIFVKGVPKFADIGLVTDIVATGQETTFLGTVGYIPPEGPGTPAADVFSLGKLLYQTCTGLECKSFPELPSNLNAGPDRETLRQLHRIILKACDDDVKVRYRTAADLHAALSELRHLVSARAK